MEDRASSKGPAPRFRSATHAVLFHREPERACDVCGAPVEKDDALDDGAPLPTVGVYLNVRGDERREETVPVCAKCSLAIGMAALARWDVEEEEG